MNSPFIIVQFVFIILYILIFFVIVSILNIIILSLLKVMKVHSLKMIQQLQLSSISSFPLLALLYVVLIKVIFGLYPTMNIARYIIPSVAIITTFLLTYRTLIKKFQLSNRRAIIITLVLVFSALITFLMGYTLIIIAPFLD